METVLALFGFTTLESTLWNLAAYVAFISIIIGVCYERGRTVLITLGALVLALYAGFFLKDPVFAALQTLITVSGVMQLRQVERRTSIIILLFLTICAVSLLAFGGVLQDNTTLVGVGGLLAIAFGIILLPQFTAFLVMAIGGILLADYAWAVGAWVFFWLNIFFALANIKELFTVRA